MINNRVTYFLKQHYYDTFKINRLIVSAFCRINKVEVKNNKLLLKHIIVNEYEEEDLLNEFIVELQKKYKNFDFESVINLFEFVISPEEKEVNGAIYTPKYIRDYIISQTVEKSKSQSITICDIACGCGGFLIDSAIVLNKRGVSYSEIFQNNIYGVDIAPYSIERTQLLLSLLAVSQGEDKKEFVFNLFVGNSLEFDWFEASEKILNSNGFDYVLGNPPYVSAENIDEESKKLASKFKTANVGKLDLYIPFFEIALSWLNKNGALGYITVNSFYRSLNGRNLRSFFSENKYNFKLVDFGNEQVFKGRITYTCVCVIENNEGVISYTNTNSSRLNNLSDNDFLVIDYNSLNDYDGWLLDDYNTTIDINKLENSGDRLDDFVNIKNGFATLRNKIYLFTPKSEDEVYFYFSKNEKEYKVEKDVCRQAIKPNILKCEKEIEEKIEYLIFPYHTDNDKLSVFEESFFSDFYTEAYNYLKEHKSELAKRDNGNKKYEKWYAFGRNQALMVRGQKLLFPYLSNKPYFVYTDNEDLLFYNGYAMIDDDKEKLTLLQVILNSDIFWYYIKTTSKPYSSGYYSFAKNYVKHFTIPNFTKSEQKKLMGYKKKSSINKFLTNKYGLIGYNSEI